MYYPFDVEKVKKYVITDDYLPMWEVPNLQDIYTKLDYNFKDTLLVYMRQQGRLDNIFSFWSCDIKKLPIRPKKSKIALIRNGWRKRKTMEIWDFF